MRILTLESISTYVALVALVGCGKGHSDSLDADASDDSVDASADAGTDTSPWHPPPPTDASPEDASVDAGTTPPTCTGAPSYPTAACGLSLPVGQSPGLCPVPHDTCGSASACPINEAKCGSASTCLPMAQNSSGVWDFRVRSMQLAAPPALAQSFVQQAVFTKNIDLPAKECGETGNGGLNWLLRFDSATGTLTTGGAPPSSDPFGAGFCFYDKVLGTGTAIHPSTACASWDGATLTSDIIPSLMLPIFLNADLNNVVAIPVHDAQLSRIQISADHACAGQFHHEALDSTCSDDPSGCAKWSPGGAVAGAILLEDADKIMIADLAETLCVLLTQSVKDPMTEGCQRDASGKIKFPGNYCSTTRSAGGCVDSFWFGATFSASAALIHDAPNGCQ